MRRLLSCGLAVGVALWGCGAGAQATRTVSEGQIKGELVLPAKTPAPGIFVLHTAFGRVNSFDIAMAKALAAAGFVAFAPEYPLSTPPDSWVPAYLQWLKARPEVAGQPLGAVGFSAGGSRVFAFAVNDPSVKAVVAYYGSYDYRNSPLANLRRLPSGGPISVADRINAATLMFYGDRDTESTADQAERMKQALSARNVPVEVVGYPGAYHGFDRGPEAGSDRTTNGTIMAYDSKAAADAQQRTIAWFKTWLK